MRFCRRTPLLRGPARTRRAASVSERQTGPGSGLAPGSRLGPAHPGLGISPPASGPRGWLAGARLDNPRRVLRRSAAPPPDRRSRTLGSALANLDPAESPLSARAQIRAAAAGGLAASCSSRPLPLRTWTSGCQAVCEDISSSPQNSFLAPWLCTSAARPLRHLASSGVARRPADGPHGGHSHTVYTWLVLDIARVPPRGRARERRRRLPRYPPREVLRIPRAVAAAIIDLRSGSLSEKE